MSWIHDYQLFLFDLDGLLVNTERFHYEAYKRALSKHKVILDWDFKKYCSYAHYSSKGVKERLFHEFPQLEANEAIWEQLYKEKKTAMIDLLQEREVETMPGAAEFLIQLQEASLPRCVVTHSPQELVAIIRKKNRILDTIPFWITREHYVKPKPDPECYLKAIQEYAKPESRIIGFEDTPRGIEALFKTSAIPVLISEIPYPEIPSFLAKGALHFSSFTTLDIDKQHSFC